MPSYFIRRYSVPSRARGGVGPDGGLRGRSDDATGFAPPTDVFETSEGYEIRMELAGVKTEDISIVVTEDNRELIISGTRYAPGEANPAKYLNLEIQYGAFGRTILLPTRVDGDSAVASYKDGYLTVRVPKIEPMEGRKSIPIQAPE